jgi:hypothetical protein
MPLSLKGSSSGQVTLDVPAVSGVTNVIVPSTNGTLIVADTSNYVYSSTLRLKGTENFTIYETAAGQTLKIATNNSPVVLAPAQSNAVVAFSNGNVIVGTQADTSLKFYVNGSAAGAIGTLTDAANIAPNMTLFNNFSVTLAGNRNLDNPAAMVPGQSGIIYISQDLSGQRSMTFGSYWKFTDGIAPTLSITASATDALVYSVRNTTSITAQLIKNIG